MKRYRIISNGNQYRVQRREKLGPLDFWRTERFYEVRKAYPKVVKHSVEFDTMEAAEAYVAEALRQTKPPPEKRRGRWRVVGKYSDKAAPGAAH